MANHIYLAEFKQCKEKNFKTIQNIFYNFTLDNHRNIRSMIDPTTC